jgi:N-carbamoylputrescine amidase
MTAVADGQRFRVGLLQLIAAGSDQEANLRIGERACRRAADLGSDLALFPELWSIGYSECPDGQPGRTHWPDLAVDTQSPFVDHFRDLAAQLDMAIGITYLQRWDPRPRNVISVIDRHGAVPMTYAKVHTVDWGTEAACTPGDEFSVCELDTARGTVALGAMICYDREFPESARVLMLKGAELILTPNYCWLDEPRITQFRARAYENMVGLAMANYAAPQQNGHSIAVDAVMYDDDGNAVDPVLVEAGQTEGVYCAEFDIEALRNYRSHEVWGDAYRKPGAYRPLLSASQLDVFRRSNARGRAVTSEPGGPLVS